MVLLGEDTMTRSSRRDFLRIVVVGLTAGSATLITGCTTLGVGGSPVVVVQVRQSIETMSIEPDHAKVGQHIRFHVEVADNFSHQFEADGTPFNNIDVIKTKPMDFDWTPDKPGTFQFSCDNPGHKEKAKFTVEP
jgi:plastocyanin